MKSTPFLVETHAVFRSFASGNAERKTCEVCHRTLKTGGLLMPEILPDGITREDVLQAIRDIDAGVGHGFAESTVYDVVFEGRRYPPKAVLGLAARRIVRRALGPYDFKGGEGSKCFRILRDLRFYIVPKSVATIYPDEASVETSHIEGAVQTVRVNRYERDAMARQVCIDHYGARCTVCSIEFAAVYGKIGENFMHVHHLRPLASIGQSYRVDPVLDLRPVCPNCHAMIHSRHPPFAIETLRALIRRVTAAGK